MSEQSTYRTVLNLNNRAYEQGGYKTFLGDDLGLGDSINTTYPDIDAMYKLQRSQFWTEMEIDLSKDRTDLLEADKNTRDVMLLNLMTQWALDATASRGIIQTFGDFISNTEVLNLLMIQSTLEGIHSLQYSEIVRVCYNNPIEAMKQIEEDASMIYRTAIIGKVFNETNIIKAKYLKGELRKDNTEDLKLIQTQLLKNLATLYGLEAISFMASFACTFALTSTGKFQGIDKSVGLICRDEALHFEGDRLIFKAFKSEIPAEVYEEAKSEMQVIFDEIVRQELHWSEYVFSEGRHVLGLNTEMLQQYVYYIAKPCFDYLGLEWNYSVVTKNPLPYMDKYTNVDSVQVAPQELEITNYRVAAVDSEVADEFEFDL